MKTLRSVAGAVAALLLVVASAGNAWADRGHFRGHSRLEVFIGPTWDPWFYPQPFYYPAPPIIIERAPPPVYIEQPQALQRQVEPTGYWYFCKASNAYYPYVKECPAGWQRVSPSPADQR